MKLTVLTDNNTLIDEYYVGEPGLCFYLEDEGEAVLLDCGYSDVFLRNAAVMGLPLGDVGTIVFSHGHNDHTAGLPHFFKAYPESRPRIVAHPLAFACRVDESGVFGSPLGVAEIGESAALVLSGEPVQVTKNCWFLGEIATALPFEERIPDGEIVDDQGARRPDYCLDDSALVYVGKAGLHILTGCSHSGICSILEAAKGLFPGRPVASITGGLHLREAGSRVEQTAAYLKENAVRGLYPCHCTSFAAKAAIHAVIPVTEIGVGTRLELE